MQNKENKYLETPRKRWIEFLRTLGIAVIPFVILLIFIFARAGKGGELLWMGTALFTVLVAIVCAIFALAGKPRIALGILAAILIGVIGLVVSCTSVLSSIPAA